MPESTSQEFVALQQALAGRYSLEREIGRGGMGVVFLARDVALDRPVAIKLLPSAMAADVELRERFLREARTAAQFSHPNIVPIHLVEERDGSIYFVMALVEGESLGERVRRVGPLPSSEVVRILQEVAWALAYAHGRGVVHRDIKPDNILLERGSGRAMLTDFGIARSLNAATSGTLPGLILGTLQYIAPEQADGTVPVDGRADLYALGVTAFYALTGRLPFESTVGAKLLAAHMLEPAPAVASISSTVPPRLAEVVDRCLLKDPSLRWQTGEEMAAALASQNQSAQAMPPTIRRFVTAVTTAIGQVSLVGIALMWSWIIVPEEVSVIAKLLGLIALAPLIPIIESARAMAIAGYRVDDVSVAVRADRTGSDGYTQYVSQSIQRSHLTLRTGLGRTLFGVLGVVQLAGAMGMLFSPSPVFAWWKFAIGLIVAIPLAWLGVECLGYALQIRPFKHRLPRYIETQAARDLTPELWSSWPIRAFLAIGRKLLWTMPGLKAAPPTIAAHKPTEVLLAAAADEIYSALGAEDRAAAAAVPEAVRQMQRAAAELRRKQASLEAAIAAVGDTAGNAKRGEVLAQLKAERSLVAERLRSTVEAMENLRLDLLKLRAGVGSAGELTAAIAAAQRVGEGITYTLQGRAEASKLA